MGILYNMFLISIGGIFGCTHLNKRYEEMLPMTTMLIVVTLFVFYMLNIVAVGYYLLIVVGLLFIILSAKKFCIEKDKRKDYIANFFTPGLLIFAILSFIIFIIVKNNYVSNFDELRLWGLYPKSIFLTNKLMLGNGLFSTEYFPGMPLFQYFFAKSAGYFSEGHLFLSYSLLMLSFIMPITKKIKWRDYWKFIPFIILLFTYPMIFGNSGADGIYYYRSLFIDPALGITFGYSLFLSTKDLRKDKFLYVLFCLSISMIILMKVVGLVLAGCVLLSYLVNQLFIYHSYKKSLSFKKKNVKNYIQLLLPALIVALTFFSWISLCQSYRNSSDNPASPVNGSSVTNAVNLFLNPTKDQKTFFNTYEETIKTNTMIYNSSKYTSKLTLPNITIAFLVIMFIMFFAVSKDNKKIIVSASIFGVLSVIIFVLFYGYIYVFTFNSVILCYMRYVSPVLGGLSIVVLYFAIEKSENMKKSNLGKFLICCLILTYFYNLPKLNESQYYKEYEDITQNLSNIVLTNIKVDKKPINLLTVYNYCDSQTYSCVLYQHQLFLSLIDDEIYAQPTGIYIAGKDIVPPNFYIPINNNNFIINSKNYEYILFVEDIINPTDEIKELFGEDLKSGDIFKRIENENGIVRVEKIN